DALPAANLGVIYTNFGQHEKALAEAREALRLNPESGHTQANLVGGYYDLNRLEDARATAEAALAKAPDSPQLQGLLYGIAFLKNDAPGMARRVAWAAGKPGVEDVMLFFEANTAAFFGRLKKARGLSRQAVASAERAEQKETAANYEANAALREAFFGNAPEARQRAGAALELSTGRDVQYGVALSMALSGDG